jgi:hypothetical protein
MGFTQKMVLDNEPSGLTTGDKWFSGITEKARELHRENLTVDFTLTSITFDCKGADGVSGTDPAIIRIYQNEQKSMAAILEVSGTGIFSQSIKVDITAAQGSTRTMIIDAFDPDDTSPNNDCAFTGSISITGKPKISDKG